MLVGLGADFTVISEGDAKRFGLDYRMLMRADKDLGGIGGKVETYTAEAVLKIEPDFIDRRKILVMKNKISENVPDKEKKQLENLRQRMPSILG